MYYGCISIIFILNLDKSRQFLYTFVMYTIKEFARIVNRSVRTLQRWDKNGVLIAYRHPSGHRYYTTEHLISYSSVHSKTRVIAVYYRVCEDSLVDSVYLQHESMHSVIANLNSMEEYFDIGSGFDMERGGFSDMVDSIAFGKIGGVVCSSRYRLMCSGYGWLERFCSGRSCSILTTCIDDRTDKEIISDAMFAVNNSIPARYRSI